MLKLADILNYLKERTREPRLIWSGGHHMSETQRANFSDYVSNQPNGIVLVFSAYTDGKVQNWGFHSFFILKKVILNYPGNGHMFKLSTSKFAHVATKYLYISNTGITGHADNNDAKATTAAGSGIKSENNYFVLREVWGI